MSLHANHHRQIPSQELTWQKIRNCCVVDFFQGKFQVEKVFEGAQ